MLRACLCANLGALKGVELKPKLLLTFWGLNVSVLTPFSLLSLDLLLTEQSQQ